MNIYILFWNLMSEKYITIQKCAHLSLTIFTSIYLCEASYSKMNNAKNMYKNHLPDSHFNDLLRVAYIYYKFV